jgi:peptide/nickel transport system substrate-binding protein
LIVTRGAARIVADGFPAMPLTASPFFVSRPAERNKGAAMAERSGFGNFLLVVIAVILGLGFYWTINAVDLLRRREESLVKEVQGLGGSVRRLTDAVESGRLAVAPAAAPAAPGVVQPGQTAAPAPAKPARPRFANLSERDPNAVEGDGIVLATSGETGNMNYIINNEYDVSLFWEYCTDTLAERNAVNPDIFEPELAEDWEISDDKLTYTIHLRKGALWQDFTDPTTGERFENVEVTAKDFQFFLDVIRNPGIPCDPMRVYHEDLDRIEIVDDYTFKVVWKKPYFLSEEVTLLLFPLPRHFYRFDPAKPEEFVENNERNRMIVGCGPWVLDRWDKGKEIVFVRNENYYGPKPYLKRKVYKIIREPNARLQAFKNGELDRIGLQPEQWVSDAATPEFEARFNKYQYHDLSYYYLGYNMRKKMFADRLTRLALTHLMDRQRIIDEVLHGLGVITTGTFFVGSNAYDHSIVPYPCDVAKAKAFLAEAGWADTDGDGVLERDGEKFEFQIMIVSTTKIFEKVAEIAREDFAKAGIVANILPLEWSVFQKRVDEWNFDAMVLGWALGWSGDPYQIWHSSQATLKQSSNHVGFANAEADRVIEEARVEFDVDKRNELFHRLHRVLHEEQPYTFLFAPEALIAQDKRYRNAKIYPIRMDANFFWVPSAEQKYRE